MLNDETEIMDQAFSRTMLFLTFIKGPNVQEWVAMQVSWLGRRICQGAGKCKEFLYDTIMDTFNGAFMDTMSVQKAKAESQNIKWNGETSMLMWPSSKGLPD